MLCHERELWSKGVTYIAGVDEAGRGPLAGPVVAAAVIFPRDFFLSDVDDSKELSSSQRESLYHDIISGALAIGVGSVDHITIDEINILQATFRAMHKALAQLSIAPQHLLVDGNRFEISDPFDDNRTPHTNRSEIPYTTIVDGDALSFSIAAASIVAKVTRDRMMEDFDEMYPGYGFAKHKGYATVEHREAIRKLGYCDIHRRSFAFDPQLELNL
jgi:ribonuclease HII